MILKDAHVHRSQSSQSDYRGKKTSSNFIPLSFHYYSMIGLKKYEFLLLTVPESDV